MSTSTTDRPAPPIASDVDLRDFDFMPLDVRRLRDSDAALCLSAEAFRACVLLWAAAWHQVPAGSLPDNDHALMRMAGLDERRWNDVRADVRETFTLCSDGRLYHPVICEKAEEAFKRRERFAKAGKASASARKARKRQEKSDATSLERCSSDVAATSQPRSNEASTRTGDKGQGTGDRPPQPPHGVSAEDLSDELCKAIGMPPDTSGSSIMACARWLADGIDPAVIRMVVVSRGKGRTPRTLQYFDAAVREEHTRRRQAMPAAPLTNGRREAPSPDVEKLMRLVDRWAETGTWEGEGPPPQPGSAMLRRYEELGGAIPDRLKSA